MSEYKIKIGSLEIWSGGRRRLWTTTCTCCRGYLANYLVFSSWQLACEWSEMHAKWHAGAPS